MSFPQPCHFGKDESNTNIASFILNTQQVTLALVFTSEHSQIPGINVSIAEVLKSLRNDSQRP